MCYKYVRIRMTCLYDHCQAASYGLRCAKTAELIEIIFGEETRGLNARCAGQGSRFRVMGFDATFAKLLWSVVRSADIEDGRRDWTVPDSLYSID